MSLTPVGVCHQATMSRRVPRTSTETFGPLFNPHLLRYLAATAVIHHIEDADEPGDAVRWSLALAGLAFSKDAGS
jgi:hypothetical protein